VQTAEPEVTFEQGPDSRCAILKAARALAEREGVKNLTLAKVAAEALLPRAFVCSQFGRKKDLLNFVAADSVATLARSVGAIDWRSNESRHSDATEGAVILALPRRNVATVASTATVERASEDLADLAASYGTSGVTSQAIAMGQIVSPNEPAREPDDTPTRAPYIWLERRLRVFERAMAAMDARLMLGMSDRRSVVESKNDSNGALQTELSRLTTTWEENVRQIQERLTELATRIAVSESHQTASLNDVRTSLSDTGLRLQMVEGVVRAALVENDAARPDAATALPAPVPVEPIAGVPIVNEAGESDLAAPRPASYLAAARASAIAASKSLDVEEAQKTPVPLRNHTAQIAAAIAVACVVLAVGFMFTRSLWNVRSEPRTQASRQASIAMVAAAADAPLDRLVQSAEAGDANSELAIALRYLNGNVSARDPISGLRWMTRAAKHGSPVAQFMLGYLYEKGGTVAADPAQAMHWYEAAALQGNRKAMHNLAVAYAQGLGGQKNPAEAVRWFSRAASFGYIDSQFDLAVLYERGDGVRQSLIDAYKWYAIAGAQGDAESRTRTDALRTQLPAQAVAAAQRAANTFRALPFDFQANMAPALHG